MAVTEKKIAGTRLESGKAIAFFCELLGRKESQALGELSAQYSRQEVLGKARRGGMHL